MILYSVISLRVKFIKGILSLQIERQPKEKHVVVSELNMANRSEKIREILENVEFYKIETTFSGEIYHYVQDNEIAGQDISNEMMDLSIELESYLDNKHFGDWERRSYRIRLSLTDQIFNCSIICYEDWMQDDDEPVLVEMSSDLIESLIS